MQTAAPTTAKRPKVIICGAGIGGLTVAHELAKKNFDVVVYERNPVVGGLARSRYYVDPATQHSYPVEYSWRIYGAHYKNMHRLFTEIPLRGEKKPSAKTVFSNLVRVWTYIFPRFDKKEVVVSRGKNVQQLLSGFAPGDRLKILNKVLYCMTMSPERMDSLDNLTWKEFCKDLSPEARKYLVTMWGPVLGMDPTYMSFPVIARMLQVIMGAFIGATGSLFVMNKPTNQGWFDEWTAYLEGTGKVRVKTDHEIMDLKMRDGMINRVAVKDRKSNIVTEEAADYVVCALSVEAIAAIVEKNPELNAQPTLHNTVELAKRCRQVQLSVQVFLDQKLVYPVTGPLVLYLPDTPWAIIIEPQDLIWGQTYSSNKKVKTVLSVGICHTDVPGILFGKSFVKCNEKEIQQEVWAQITKSYKCSSIKTEKGGGIETANVELFYMWDSFTFDQNKKEITVWEPKFSNNAGSLRYQPAHTTEVPNLFFATAYTKTHRYIYSMEAAVEAGTNSANEIVKKNNALTGRDEAATPVHAFSSTLFLLKPLLLLDRFLLKIGLPHISTVTFGSTLAFLILSFLLLVAIVIGVIVLVS
jgi:uncharacterized protein with NAD-binding domain and iron-sulfur cluster